MGKPNPQNLIPINLRSTEEQRRIREMAAEQKHKEKEMRDLLKGIVNEPMDNGKPKGDYLMRKLVDMAAKGNIKALELILRVLKQFDDAVTLTINQPRDLTPEEAAALQKHLEENY